MGTAPAPAPFVFNFPTEDHPDLLTVKNPAFETDLLDIHDAETDHNEHDDPAMR